MRKDLSTLVRGVSLTAVGMMATAGASAQAPEAAIPISPANMLPVRTIDERFQSFQIGFSHLTGGETWKSYDQLKKEGGDRAKDFSQVREARAATDLSSPRLRTLTAALSPLYVRYSGTTANSAYFHDSDGPAPSKAPEGFTVVLTRAAWKGAVDFARAVNAEIITSFANSEGTRDSAGGWSPKMAQSWVSYTRSIGGKIYAAELFNEPNAPEPPRIPKGKTPEEYANDYAVFRPAIKVAAPDMKLAGPGTATLGIPGVNSIGTSSEQYFTAIPAPKVDIVSYHFYPALAQRCAPPTSLQGMSEDRALTEEWLSRPDAELSRQKELRDRFAPGAQIWLTETGGAACGGLTWQPTFLDVFRYVDLHGRMAKQGLDVIFTHALISGSNGIIDEKTLEPNASYWAAVLWRRLMGTRVLDAGAQPDGLHLYAHCQRGAKGGVSLIAINLRSQIRTLQVAGRTDLYALTSDNLESRTVLLNGKPLAVTNKGQLPKMSRVRSNGRPVTLAPLSVNFLSMPDASNTACAS